MAIEITGFFPGDRSGKVRWLAYELGLEVQDQWIRFPDTADPDFRALSPLRVVPVVRIDGVPHRESTAIGHLLVERFGPELGIAPGAPERAAYLTWIATFAENVEQKLVECAVSKNGLLPPELYEANAPQLKRRMPVLAKLLPSEGFLCGRFTFADIVAAYSLRLAVQTGLLERDAVEPYLGRLIERPAAQQAKFFDGLS